MLKDLLVQVMVTSIKAMTGDKNNVEDLFGRDKALVIIFLP